MGKFVRHGYYRTLMIYLKTYEEHKKRKAEATKREDVLRMLGWEQASVAILENMLKYVEELIDTDEEVNELIKNGEVSKYYA